MKTLRNSSIITLALVALALLVAAPVAFANIVSYSGSIAPELTNFPPPPATGTVQQFNPSLGTLNSVQITLAGGGMTDLTVSAIDPASPTVFTALFTDLALELTDPSDADVATLENMSGGPSVSPLHPITVVFGSPYDSGVDTLAGLAGSQTLNSNLSSFIGLGDVTFDLAGAANTTESFTGGDFTAGQTTNAGAEITVTYDYSTGPVVPEPGTLSLFGTGLLGLAGMLRRKFAKS
jgi:hypothetical protein